MSILGYVVQFSNEDDYTVYHGFMKLHKHFTQALERAQEEYRSFLEQHLAPGYDGPFQIHTPTKKQCDNQGSVVVFESRSFIVWIDCVVE